MKQLLVIGGAVAVLFLLMFAGTRFMPAKPPTGTPGEVACLPAGHQNLVTHIHPTIEIKTNGMKETVSGNIGLTSTCMREVHTHDASGVIHIEAVTVGREFGINHFFTVWGKSMDREGMTRVVRVNGSELSGDALAQYRMKDRDRIEVLYTSTSSSTGS